MKYFKPMIFVMAVLTLGACKKAEESPRLIGCPGSGNFEYRNLLDNQPHRVNFSDFGESVFVTAFSDLDQLAKIKLYAAEDERVENLCQEVLARVHCYGPSEPVTLVLNLLLVSYRDTNGNYCELPLTIDDPITVKMEELFSDVILTGDENTILEPTTSTND